MHVDEDLAERAVLELAGPEIDLVAADDGLLRVAAPPMRQAPALALANDLLDDALGDGERIGLAHRGERHVGPLVLRLLLEPVAKRERGERLGELGAIAVERVGLEAEAPGKLVGPAAVLDGAVHRQVDGLRDGAGDEGLRRRHHAHMALGREAAVRAGPPAGIGAVEDWQMLGPEVRRAFQRHRTAAIEGGRLDLARAETQSAEQIEARPVEVGGIEAERAGAEVGTERPLVEREVQVEGGIEGGPRYAR